MNEQTLERLERNDYEGFLSSVETDDTITGEEKISVFCLFGSPEKAAALRSELDLTQCQHLSTNSDNYGESCAVCGKQLKGYGYGGWFGSNLNGTQRCIHDFIDLFGGKVCRFCEKQED